MNRVWTLFLSGILWALMMWQLFEREIVPYFEYQAAPSYRTLLRSRPEPEVRRYSIYSITRKVGEMETLTAPEGSGAYFMETRISMKLPTGLGEAALCTASRTEVDEDFKVKGLRVLMDMGVPIALEGVRRGEFLDLTYKLPMSPSQTKSVRISDEDMLGDSFMPFVGGGRLKPGKKWKIPMVDIMGLLRNQGAKHEAPKEEYAFADVGEMETIKWQGRDVVVYPVTIKPRATSELPSHQIYVAEDGTVLSTKYFFAKNSELEFRLDDKQRLKEGEARNWSWHVSAPHGWKQ